MGIPSIGSARVSGPPGHTGVVVGARELPADADGRRQVALRIQSRSPNAATAGNTARSDAARPGDSLSGLKAELAQAIRDRDTARPAVARTPDQLSPQDRTVVESLRQRDAQVRQEETAHAGVAGSLAGPISYVYQRGPDGRQYAVGGSVPISAQAVTGSPDEARRLGGRIAAAALAATNPSAADLSAAAAAYRFAPPEAAEISDSTAAGVKSGTTLDRSA